MNPSKRRQFLLAAGALLAARVARAQPGGKLHRIGWLTLGRPTTTMLDAFKDSMRELGQVEGRTYAVVVRSADGKLEQLDAVAAELAGGNVDVIVTNVNATTRAAARATRTIPIVMTVGTDVVGEKFVASLARPGGNITGVTWDAGVDVMAKRFQFLSEAVPKLTRVAVLWDPGQDAPSIRQAIEEGGKAVGVKLIWPLVSDDLEAAFALAVREGAQALFTGGGNRMYLARNRIVELAAKHRLPDTHYDSAFVDAGGLMSYAPNLAALFRAGAKFVDRILKGAKPGDLPVELPMRIDLVINLKTAKALGLKIPQSLLLRADRVIE